jgi:hypothetical protein
MYVPLRVDSTPHQLLGLCLICRGCRRPLTSPSVTPPAMVELIVRARADLAVEGWDNGGWSIFYRLLREGVQPPSWRTVHWVLVRQGLVVP